MHRKHFGLLTYLLTIVIARIELLIFSFLLENCHDALKDIFKFIQPIRVRT